MRDWERNRVTHWLSPRQSVLNCASLWENKLDWPAVSELQHWCGRGRTDAGTCNSGTQQTTGTRTQSQSCSGGSLAPRRLNCSFRGCQCLCTTHEPSQLISLFHDPKTIYLHKIFVMLILPNTLLSWTYSLKSFNF